MNADPNLHFEANSSSKQLLDKYCSTFAGSSVSASALATVAALLSLSTAGDHPLTPTGTISSAPSVTSAASSGQQSIQQPRSLSSPKGSEPSPRTPSSIAERFHVYLCNGHEDHSGSDASSCHTTDSSASRRSLPSPLVSLPDSWTATQPGRHSSSVYTFHYCVKSCGPNAAFAVYEAKIIPVGSNILLATAPLFVSQSRLTDITTFQAPTIGVFVRESTSIHRRRQLSTTPYTPESIVLYSEVLAELLRNSPFMAAVSPRTPPPSKPSTQRLDSSISNTPEYRFAGHNNGTSSSSSFGSAQNRFGDTELRPHLGNGQVGADGESEHPTADAEHNGPWEA